MCIFNDLLIRAVLCLLDPLDVRACLCDCFCRVLVGASRIASDMLNVHEASSPVLSRFDCACGGPFANAYAKINMSLCFGTYASIPVISAVSRLMQMQTQTHELADTPDTTQIPTGVSSSRNMDGL